VRRDGVRLWLDCNGGALELTEIQPPGGRRMAAAEWLRGRPDPRLTDFWLDPALPDQDLDTLVFRAIEEWDVDAEWAPALAALCWRGDAAVLERMRDLAGSPEPRERAVAAYVLGQLGVPTRTRPADSAAGLEAMAAAEADPMVLATIAHAFGNLGPEYGTDLLLRLREHPEAAVRAGVVQALAGRDAPQVVPSLIALSSDPDEDIRDWATFALGSLADRDDDEIREALVARLDDPAEEPRLEAVHGLALRRDARATEAALALLAAHDDGTDLWGGHALEESAIRLAALTGDERFREHLPPMDDRWRGTELGRELERALERTAGDQPA
jgi:HEAT repeat protein